MQFNLVKKTLAARHVGAGSTPCSSQADKAPA